MAYIGNTPTTQSFISGTDYFNGTGSQTAFTLSRTVNSPNDVEAVVNNVVQQPNSGYTISGTTITFTSAPSAGSSNIYVRYLSTTTQTITPSQATVSDSSFNSNIANRTYAFKNRIINPGMVIDQRNAGASITPTNNQYTTDRWQFCSSQASKFTAQQNQGAVTLPAGFANYLGFTSSSAYSVSSTDYFFLVQRIEGFNTADLAWGTNNAKTVTLSFQVYSSLTGTFGGSLTNNGDNRSYPFTYTISSANTWTPISITIPGDITGTWATTTSAGINVTFSLGAGSTRIGTAGAWAGAAYYGATGQTNIVGTSGATFYITGVQLELGTQATSFDYRPYGTELALCQRYTVKYLGTGNYEKLPVIPFCTNSTNVNGVFVLPVTMRASPSISQSSISVSTTGGNSAITAVSVEQLSPSAPSFAFTASGLTANNAVLLQASNTTAAYVILSAEL